MRVDVSLVAARSVLRKKLLDDELRRVFVRHWTEVVRKGNLVKDIFCYVFELNMNN